MRIFVDCEFNGFGGELMSMAMVAEDGSEWYEVLPLPASIDPWVLRNVVPKLDRAPVSLEVFRNSFWAFLRQFERPTIVADWYTDIVHFFTMFAGSHHGESVDFPCRVELVSDLKGYAPEVPHNALSDARAICACVHGGGY